MNECGEANNFFYKDGKKIERQACEIYSRCMGYMRPVSFYNIGKKTEFYSRKYFSTKDMDIKNFSRFNEEFIKKYY